jgi:hypothetical protein
MDRKNLFHQSSPTQPFQPLQKQYGKLIERKLAFQPKSQVAPTCSQTHVPTAQPANSPYFHQLFFYLLLTLKAHFLFKLFNDAKSVSECNALPFTEILAFLYITLETYKRFSA